MNNQFDIRRLIGGLLLLCGIVLVITGAVGGAYVKHNAADINIDLGTGLGMLAVGLMMIARAPWSHRTPPHPSRSSRPEPTRPRRQPSGPGNAGAARALRLLAPRTARDPAAPAAHHRRAYLGELVGTTVLLLGTVTVVRWVFATNSALAQALPGLHIKIAVVALTVGTLLGLLIISPLGRSSGGHFNPAMTVSFWLLGALPGADVARYVTAQALGSVTGTALGRLVWGPIVSRSPVAYAVVQPASGSTHVVVFIVEATSILALVGAVTFFLARPALARWTPAVAGVAVAALISTTGAWTGGSFNPARQLGPALLSGQSAFLAFYIVGPLAGAVAAAALHRLNPRKRVLDCQLCGT